MLRGLGEATLTKARSPESDKETHSWGHGSSALASSAWPMRTFLQGLMEFVVVRI